MTRIPFALARPALLAAAVAAVIAHPALAAGTLSGD